MLIRNMLIKYYSVVSDEGGDDGGSDGGAPEITPKVQKPIDEQVNAQVSGLKNESSELLGKFKESTESLKRFEGTDLDAVKTILQRFSDDEETQLITARKIDKVLDKHIERPRADVDKQTEAANERAEKAEAFSDKFRDRVLGDAIRSTALKTDALPEASSDLILRAKGTFQLNDEDEAVAVGANGGVLFGKGGKTPLTPVEWAEPLKETAPHLFPHAEGSGAGGHKPDGGGGSLKRSGMSSSDKADYTRKHDRRAYLKLLK